MIEITIPAYELFNDVTGEFESGPSRDITLEHSLLSISKWESKWLKPFLSNVPKTDEEVVDYIRCMTLNKGVPPEAYYNIPNNQYELINKYITAPMTATTISDPGGKPSREILTSELIYYYMISNNIPMECEKWHINRLMTLIRVFGVKNNPGKKRPMADVMKSNAELNAARKKKLNTKG